MATSNADKAPESSSDVPEETLTAPLQEESKSEDTTVAKDTTCVNSKKRRADSEPAKEEDGTSPPSKKVKIPTFGASTGFGGFAEASKSGSGGFGTNTTTSVGFGTSSGTGFGAGFGSTTTSSGGFGGFGSIAKKDDTNSSSTTTNGFGILAKESSSSTKAADAGAVSSSPPTSLFGNKSSNSAGGSGFSFTFGKSSKPSEEAGANESTEEDGATTTSSNPQGAAALPQDYSASTGEEGEVSVHTERCKTYKWVLDDETSANNKSKDNENGSSELGGASSRPINPSVKPSSDFMNKAPSKDDDDKTTEKEKSEDDTATNSDKKDDSKKSGKESDDTAKDSNSKGRWQEVGVGPFKILQSQSDPLAIRVVQRRESSKNGNATKVILNLPIWKESVIDTAAEKYLKVTSLGQTGKEIYMLRFKLDMEKAIMNQYLADMVSQAKSAFEPTAEPASVEAN